MACTIATTKRMALVIFHHDPVAWCGVVWCGVVWCGVVQTSDDLDALANQSWNDPSQVRHSSSNPRCGCMIVRAP
jgi:hypothetical protein